MPKMEWMPDPKTHMIIVEPKMYSSSVQKYADKSWQHKHFDKMLFFVQNARAELEAAKALDDTAENRVTKLVCEMALEIGEIEYKIAELFEFKCTYGFAKDSSGNFVHGESHARFDAQIQAHRKELDDMHAAHIATVPEGESKVSWWTKLFELSKRIPCADDVRPRSDDWE